MSIYLGTNNSLVARVSDWSEFVETFRKREDLPYQQRERIVNKITDEIRSSDSDVVVRVRLSVTDARLVLKQ